MTNQVKAEARAVRATRKAVVGYADALRGAVGVARRAVDDAERRALHVLERRQMTLRRATATWERARAEFAAADERTQAAAAQHLAHAAAALEAARAAHDRAARATNEIAGVRASLVKTLHTVEAAINETASTTSHALAELDARLVELEGDRGPALAQRVITTVGVIAQTATAGSQLGQVVTAPIHGAAGVQGPTLSQMERDRAADLQQQFADHEDIRMENERRRRDMQILRDRGQL